MGKRVGDFKKSMEPRIKEVRFSLAKIRKSPLSLVGIAIILFFITIAIFAPWIAPPEDPDDPYQIPHDGYSPIPKPPDDDHPFGTTGYQYDMFYGCIWGTRTAFRICILVIGAALLIGITLGSIAGYFGGIVDEVIMRVVDVFMAFPYLILAMAFSVAFGRSIDSIMYALILVTWPTYTRLMRGNILSVREEDYIDAARANGCSSGKIILKHVIPNSIYPVLIMASLDIGAVVLTAAALSFIGLGAPIGYADWGQLTSFSRDYITGITGDPFIYWHTVIIPGLFMLFFVLGWNLLGDALRDIMDPMLRRK